MPSRRRPGRAAPSPRLEEVIRSGLLLASELSLPALLQRLVEAAVAVTGARYGALGVLDARGELGQFITVGVSEDERAAIGDPPRGRGLIGALLEDPQPLRLRRLQDHPRSVGFPPHHPPMSSFLGAPVRAGGRLFGALYLTERGGGRPFDAEDQAALVAVATQAGVAISNASAYAGLQARQELLELLASITDTVLAGGPPSAALDTAVWGLRRLTRSQLAVLVLSPGEGEGGNGPRVVATDGEAAPPRGGPVPACAQDPDSTGRDGCRDWLAPGDAPPVELGAAPVVRRGAGTGSLLLVRPAAEGPFSLEELGQLRAVTDQVALALDAAEAQGARQRRAVVEERRRIARDLHDEPVQVLVYLARELEALAADLGAADRTQGRLEDARQLVVGVVDGLRQVAEGLRSPVLEELGLRAALADLAARVQRRAGITVELRGGGLIDRQAPERELGCLRIAQEALSNVERHARAGRVIVALARRGASLRLVVADDGVGLAHASGAGAGLGLAGMRERAAQLGGHLRLRSRPGRGTVVVARIPVRSGSLPIAARASPPDLPQRGPARRAGVAERGRDSDGAPGRGRPRARPLLPRLPLDRSSDLTQEGPDHRLHDPVRLG
ncbi:MAG TPA: GAF domain-containing protein [Verrucomicrobiae bacterium]|nr:GAF domain-containing protein [Verrucomicrobiae bacterium]